MSNDELVNLIYGYARAACRTTPLDYRDVAHTVLVNNLSRLRCGQVKYVRTYMYMAIRSTIARMMKTRFVFCTIESIDQAEYCRASNIAPDIEPILKKLTPKESLIFFKLSEGYTRKKIAAYLGISVCCVNLIWFRMIRRLRGRI